LNRLRVKSILKNTIQNKDNYKGFRKIYQRTIRAAKNAYYKEQLQIHSKNGKHVWQIINEIVDRGKKCESGFPATVDAVDGTQHQDLMDVAKTL
jgi:hypothetical protein